MNAPKISRYTHDPGRRKLITATAGLAMAGICRPLWAAAAFDRDRFVEDIRAANEEGESQKAVAEVLAREVSMPGNILRNLGEPTRAGISTLYKDDSLTILNVVWAPLMVLLPHNHNMWANIGIYSGREDNIIWRRQGGSIKAESAAAIAERDVFELPSNGIHSVVNPIQRMTGAIHIYGGDFFAPGRSEWEPESLTERPFDLKDALRTFREANDRFELGRKRTEELQRR